MNESFSSTSIYMPHGGRGVQDVAVSYRGSIGAPAAPDAAEVETLSTEQRTGIRRN